MARRDYKSEAEWQATKYSQVKFSAKKELAEKFKQHLKMHGMTAIEWFTYAVDLALVPSHKMTGCAMVGDYDISTVNTGTSKLQDTGTSKLQNTGTSKLQNTGTSIQAVQKKRRTSSPNAEMVKSWIAMYQSGMSYNAIAATTDGYDKSTIRNRVVKELTKDDTGSSTN